MRACQQKPGFLSSSRGEAGILKIRSMSSSHPVTAAGQLRGGGPATHKGDTLRRQRAAPSPRPLSTRQVQPQTVATYSKANYCVNHGDLSHSPPFPQDLSQVSITPEISHRILLMARLKT